MADVDLLRDAYRNYLGRDASEQELQGWTSGSYGGGNVGNWVDQIRNSDEARNRQPQSAPVLGPAPGESRGYDEPAQPSGGGDANFFSGLSNAYQQYLGRSASQDELNNWWSGQYGYGQGWDGYNQMVEAIRNSQEAKSRNNGQAPNAITQSLEYWHGQGVNDSDIFNTATGQLMPGWERYAGGYRRTSGGASNVPGPQNGNFQQWFQQLTQGKRVSPRTLKELEPILNQHGIKLGPLNARGFTDGILLPDGTFIDVITAATEDGGTGWSWMIPGPSGVNLPGNQYSDAYTQLLEMLLKNRIGNLGPVNDPNRAAYEQAMKDRAAQLQQGNQYLTQQIGYLQNRFNDLKGPGYTGAENEVIRTGALDPIETDRSAAKKMLAERLAARGHRPGSGVYEQAMQEVDKQFNAMRGQTQTQLAGNELARRENRNQRAEAISSQLASIPEERNREYLDVMNAIQQLSALTQAENDARQREQIQYGGVLSDLGPQRLQLAMQAAGAGGVTPSSLGALLTQIAGLNQQGQAYGAQNSNALWSGLGQLAAIIGRQNQYGLGG